MAESMTDDCAFQRAMLRRGIEIGMDLIDQFDKDGIMIADSIAGLAYVMACAINDAGRAKAEGMTIEMLNYMVGIYLDGLDETEGEA